MLYFSFVLSSFFKDLIWPSSLTICYFNYSYLTFVSYRFSFVMFNSFFNSWFWDVYVALMRSTSSLWVESKFFLVDSLSFSSCLAYSSSSSILVCFFSSFLESSLTLSLRLSISVSFFFWKIWYYRLTSSDFSLRWWYSLCDCWSRLLRSLI